MTCFCKIRPWLNFTAKDVLVTAKLIFRNEASLEENFEFSYFKYHIQNEMGQGEVGVITFSEKSIPKCLELTHLVLAISPGK